MHGAAELAVNCTADLAVIDIAELSVDGTAKVGVLRIFGVFTLV